VRDLCETLFSHKSRTIFLGQKPRVTLNLQQNNHSSYERNKTSHRCNKLDTPDCNSTRNNQLKKLSCMKLKRPLEGVDLRSLSLPLLSANCCCTAFLYGGLSRTFQYVSGTLMLFTLVLFIILSIKSQYKAKDVFWSNDKIMNISAFAFVIALILYWFLPANIQIVISIILFVAGCVVLLYWAYLFCRKRIAL
jgi:hypothetical protein